MEEQISKLEMRARQILAEEYNRIGLDGHYPTYAKCALEGDGEFTMRSIRASMRALKEDFDE